MAFTPEQEAAILEFVTKSSAAAPAAKSAGDEGATKTIAQQAKESLDSKTPVQQAKEAVKADKEAAIALSQSEQSIQFNLSIKDLIEKNKDLLPEEAAAILKTIDSKTFSNQGEKANVTRKNLLDSFLSQQENIDSLAIGSMRSRAEEYKKLAESDKEKRSSEFWDLVEVGLALKQGLRKAQALNKINGGSAGDTGNILQNKLLAAADKKFKHVK